jgi:hypothetical protein
MTPDTDRLHAFSRVPAVRGNMCVDGCLHCVESQFLDYWAGQGVCMCVCVCVCVCNGIVSGRFFTPSDKVPDAVCMERLVGKQALLYL